MHDDQTKYAVCRNFACWPPCVAVAVATSAATAQDKGTRQSAAAAAARQARRSRNPGQGTVRPPDDAGAARGAHHRLLRQGLPRRRHGAADQRPDLAGDAAVAQPQLGPSRPVQFLEHLADEGAQDSAGAGCWSATCRSRAAARCCTGHASHQVGLDADIWLTPDARPRADAPGARGNVGDHGGRRRPQGRRPEGLDAGACRTSSRRRRKDPQVERIFVNAGDQEGAVPRGRQRPRLAAARCGRGGGTTIISMSA